MNYGDATPRIGKYKGTILKHALHVEALGITGEHHKIPQNMSDTVVFRRWLPYGAAATNATTINAPSADPNAHLTQEGVTPDADQITPNDVTVELNQYSCLYMYTDKMAEMYEDNVPSAMKEQCGERMGLVREMIHYGALKGCTNKYYAGGTGRATVDETISLGFCRKISQGLQGNRGKLVTTVLAPSANFNTTSVEAAFLVFCHTDVENDIREIPGFRECAAYGSRKIVHECELGSADRFRFITSPELAAIADSGAAIGTTGLKSTTGANIDVYPVIVVAKDAWGDVALRGKDSFGVTHIPHTQKSKSDPNGQRGYLGTKFYSASFVQNDGWMAVGEVGVTDL